MDDRKIDLCHYRIKKAEDCLVLEDIDFSKHSGVMAYFQKAYVKTGIFGKEYSQILMKEFEIRSDADYDDYYVISKNDVQEQLHGTEIFLAGVKGYLDKILAPEE